MFYKVFGIILCCRFDVVLFQNVIVRYRGSRILASKSKSMYAAVDGQVYRCT